jgi:hypothetical protein
LRTYQARLAGLVAVEALGDAAVDDAAHAGDLGELGAVHDVAGARAHDGDHLAGLRRLGGGGGDVRVDVADRDGDALGQARPAGGLGRQRAGRGAERPDLVGDLRLGEVGEVGVERGEELAARVLAVLEDALVAGGAGVADVATAQLPDDPVGGLHPVLGGGVDLRVLLEQLEALGELPLARDEPAVAGQPRLAALAGELVDAVGLALRGVVAPQLDVGVRAAGELGQLVERGAVGGGRHHRAGGEVGADADHAGRVDARRGEGLRDGVLQHVDVVARHLQGPLGRQALAGAGQGAVDDRVGVLERRAAELGAVGDPYDDGPSAQGAEVDADDVGVGVVRGRCHGTSLSWW